MRSNEDSVKERRDMISALVWLKGIGTFWFTLSFQGENFKKKKYDFHYRKGLLYRKEAFVSITMGEIQLPAAITMRDVHLKTRSAFSSI